MLGSAMSNKTRHGQPPSTMANKCVLVWESFSRHKCISVGKPKGSGRFLVSRATEMLFKARREGKKPSRSHAYGAFFGLPSQILQLSSAGVALESKDLTRRVPH